MTTNTTNAPASARSDRTQLLLEVARGQAEVSGRLSAVERAIVDSRDDIMREVTSLGARQGEARAEAAALSNAVTQLAHTLDRAVERGELREQRLTEILELDRQRVDEDRQDRRAREEREAKEAEAARQRREQWWVRWWELIRQPLLTLIIALAAVAVAILQRWGR